MKKKPLTSEVLREAVPTDAAAIPANCDGNRARERMYVLAISAHQAVGVAVGDVCWGSCGKGSIAGIGMEGDSGIPCFIPAAECPHFADEQAEPCGTVSFGSDIYGAGYDVILRRITKEPRLSRVSRSAE